MKIKVSDDLFLPLDWMMMATVAYGARGSGKTTFGAVVAEEVHRAGQRFCAIDLKGDLWGLKSSADGKRPGIPVVIFGGAHADIPLEADAGKEIGEAVATLSQSCVIDLENLSKGKQLRFLAAFFEALYDANRDPLLVIADEAQRYAPQRPITPEASICLGAVEDFAKLGRKHGLGILLITQRGSGLNKEVAELGDVIVIFRTPGVLDQKRVREVLEASLPKTKIEEVMDLMSGLETGTAVIVSAHPSIKVFGTFKIRERETFDSSATPSIGKRRRAPKRLAEPDIEALKLKMRAAIERAKAEDPKALRARIAELEKDCHRYVKQIEKMHGDSESSRKIVKQSVVSVSDTIRLQRAITRLTETEDRFAKSIAKLGDTLAQRQQVVVSTIGNITTVLKRAAETRSVASDRPLPVTRLPITRDEKKADRQAIAIERRKLHAVDASGKTENVSGGALRLIRALKNGPLSRVDLGVRSVYKHTTGTFSNLLSEVRTMGFVEGGPGWFKLTAKGESLAAGMEPIEPHQLMAAWNDKLSGTEAKMLDALAAAAGTDKGALTRDELASAVRLSPTTGTFSNYLSTLRSSGIMLEPERGVCKIHPMLVF